MIRRRTWIAVACLAVVAASVALAGERYIWGGAAYTAAKGEKLVMRPPLKVDRPLVPIAFDYKSAKGDKLGVELEFKKPDETQYRTATLATPDPIAAAAGKKTYTVVWNKEADKVAAGQSVDLRLTVTNAKGGASSYDLRNYRTLTREELRESVDDYMIYYGKWDAALVDHVRGRHELVIVDARNITPGQAAEIRAGNDPRDASDDALVFGYVSVGEDLRTNGMTPEQMREDPRFVLDEIGRAHV